MSSRGSISPSYTFFSLSPLEDDSAPEFYLIKVIFSPLSEEFAELKDAISLVMRSSLPMSVPINEPSFPTSQAVLLRLPFSRSVFPLPPFPRPPISLFGEASMRRI